MSSSEVLEPTRRHLTATLSPKQAATVDKVADAVVDELRAVGYDGLTVRNVAKRAGVAPATAYTYFGSREHLVTEVFWRRLDALPDTDMARRRSTAGRVSATLADLALLVADEPELTAACTAAMLATDPDVKLLRDRIGAAMQRRLVVALGDDARPGVLDTLTLALSGAMVQAGMGHLAYDKLPALLDEVVDVVLKGSR